MNNSFINSQVVITLTKTDYGYNRSEDYLDLTTIDSLSETGTTSVECSIFDGEVLALGEFPDQWCLASEKCYFFQLN